MRRIAAEDAVVVRGVVGPVSGIVRGVHRTVITATKSVSGVMTVISSAHTKVDALVDGRIGFPKGNIGNKMRN